MTVQAEDPWTWLGVQTDFCDVLVVEWEHSFAFPSVVAFEGTGNSDWVKYWQHWLVPAQGSSLAYLPAMAAESFPY